MNAIDSHSLFHSPKGAPLKDSFLPDDPYQDESYWPNGLAQLTNKGRREMFAVGQYLRKQYDNFLGDDIGEVRMVSSPVQRCQETGRCVMSGAYEANNLTKDQLKSFPNEIDEVNL